MFDIMSYLALRQPLIDTEPNGLKELQRFMIVLFNIRDLDGSPRLTFLRSSFDRELFLLSRQVSNTEGAHMVNAEVVREQEFHCCPGRY